MRLKSGISVCIFCIGIVFCETGLSQISSLSEKQFRPILKEDVLSKRSNPKPNEQQQLANFNNSLSAEIPHLKIEIAPVDYNKLKAKRDEALRLDFLFSADDDYVSATLYFNDKPIKAELRLKGDFTDHLRTDQWSFRIKTAKNNYFMGMRRFSIQSPHTKFYHHEALFLDHVRKEGLLAVRYFFVNLTINGEFKGVMAIEEHFSKELLESQNRREGVMLKFEEDDLFRGFKRNGELERNYGVKRPTNVYDNWKVAPVGVFREKSVKKSDILSAHYKLGASMLRGLAFGTIAPEDVFDVDKLGKFMAICDLWGNWHSIRWHNIRFYLNPVTLKLEPIGFDADIDYWFVRPGVHQAKEIYLWHSVLTSSKVIQEAFRKYYNQFISDSYMDELKAFIEQREKEYLKTLYRDYPGLPTFDFNTIKSRQNFRNYDNPSFYQPTYGASMNAADNASVAYPSMVYAYIIEQDGGSHLQLVNPLGISVKVNELTISNACYTNDPLENYIDIKYPIVVPPNFHALHSNLPHPPCSAVSIALPSELPAGSYKINGKATVLSQSEAYSFLTTKTSAPLASTDFPYSMPLSVVLSKYPFLQWNDSNFILKKDEYTFTNPIILPEYIITGANEFRPSFLEIEAGAKIKAEREFFIKCTGLEAIGTNEEPIVFEGLYGMLWKGIVVNQGISESNISHVIFRDLDFTRYGALQLTGGIMFNESNVTLTNCTFENVQAEDALNIVNSQFSISNCTFDACRSDAFDSDFSQGSIANCTFKNIEGDAIDLSSTTLEMQDNNFSDINDKALSAGEASRVSAKNTSIVNANVGVASKDRSDVMFDKVLLENIRFTAFMAYEKKGEYGPSSLIVKGAKFTEVAEKSLCQHNYTMKINGLKKKTSYFDIKGLYTNSFMKKK